MSDPIAPALTVDQWREARDYLASKSAVPLGERAAEIASDVSGMVAILNDALPDDHPRKITREWIQMLRETAEEYDYLTPIADALASYLPPETP